MISDYPIPLRQLLLAIALCVCVAPVLAVPYSFTKIADSSEFPGIFTVALNNHGLVAFNTDAGVFAGNGGAVSTVVDTSSGLEGFGSIRISLNDNGSVAFAANRTLGGSGAYRVGGGLALERFFTQGRRPAAINNAGTVAFIDRVFGNFPGSNSTSGPSIREVGGANVLLYDVSSPVFDGFGHPDINDNGFLAFTAGLDSGGLGIFVGDGGVPATIASNSQGFTGFTGLALNNRSQVAFIGDTASGRGLFLGDGTAPALQVANSSVAAANATHISLNDGGDIAFRSVLPSGQEAVFTAFSGDATELISSGDRLFGSVVTELRFLQEGLNNRDQIAFMATTADGLIHVVRADKVVAMPEPGPFVLLALSLIGAVCTKRGVGRRVSDPSTLNPAIGTLARRGIG